MAGQDQGGIFPSYLDICWWWGERGTLDHLSWKLQQSINSWRGEGPRATPTTDRGQEASVHLHPICQKNTGSNRTDLFGYPRMDKNIHGGWGAVRA